jgi:hypothetical protein
LSKNKNLQQPIKLQNKIRKERGAVNALIELVGFFAVFAEV